MRSESGFTLIELIITAALVGTLVIVVSQAFTGVEQINRSARALTIATQLAQMEVEKVRNTAYANITTGTTDLSADLSPYPTLGSPRSATETVSLADANGLKQVDIAISYTIYHRTRRVQVSTLVAKVGINR